jgi:hypothetical protein
MSNFMHKVKEAVSDHRDRDRVPNNETTGTHNTFSSTDPYAKDPAASQNNPTMNPETGTGANQGFNNQGTTRAPDTYGSGMSDTNTANAGPHNSKVANKLDPRVDSDLDHRAQNQGMAPQNVGGTTQGMDAGNMAPTGQPRTFGTDNHTANEDNLNKSTQQRKAHTQPGMPGTGTQATSEDTFNSSTQEHKSHSSTSHATPCTGGMNPRAEPESGGGAAVGGSSYNQPSGMQPAGMQNANTMGKVDPQMQGTGYQQNDIGNQRSGY